ncbi:MAG: uracil-DNA glycosylase family protein, partial [Chloroflexota bacterium]
MAYRFRPSRVELLFLAESPPVSGAYFYLLPEFSKRGVPSALFWEVVRALGIAPAEGPRLYGRKEEYLAEFAGRGLFIVDAAKCPVNKISDRAAKLVIDNCTRHLRREIALLNPRHIAI